MSMSQYKLPRCWLGQEMETPWGKRLITEADVNPECQCVNPLQAHLCMAGHMLECHAGMTCEQAQCGHWQLARELDLDVEAPAFGDDDGG